jgi:diguanylate cyclase (GGDEF)-like protein
MAWIIVSKDYPLKAKLEAIRLRKEEGWSNKEITEKLEIRDPKRVENWMRVYRKEGKTGLKKLRRGRPRKDRNSLEERVKIEQHLKHLATYDPLTILPNRSLFYEHLNLASHRARRNDMRLAVFFLDLDSFKSANDLLGHSKDDELLQEVTSRFNEAFLRSSDVVARLGGDEFAFVCENLTSPEDAAVIAKKILIALSRKIQMEGQEISISGSIGISLYPEDGGEVRDLLRFADVAMFRVKDQGKQHY